MNNDNIHNESTSEWEDIPVPISEEVAWKNMNALLDKQKAKKKKKGFWLFFSLTLTVASGILFYFLSSHNKTSKLILTKQHANYENEHVVNTTEKGIQKIIEQETLASSTTEKDHLSASKQPSTHQYNTRNSDNKNTKEKYNNQQTSIDLHSSSNEEDLTANNSSTKHYKLLKSKKNRIATKETNTTLIVETLPAEKEKSVTENVNKEVTIQHEEKTTPTDEVPKAFTYLQFFPIKELESDTSSRPTLDSIIDNYKLKKYNSLVMGINAGVGLNKILWNNELSYLLPLRPAFISFFADYYFMPKFAVGMELTPFHTRGSKYTYTDASKAINENSETKTTTIKNYSYKVNTLNYSDVSLYLKHKLTRQLLIGFGIYGSYLQTANMNINLLDSVSIYNKQTKDTEYASSQTLGYGNLKQLDFTQAKTLLKKYDVGTLISAYYILNRWQLGITYQRGLISYATTKTAVKFYTQNTRITIGFRF